MKNAFDAIAETLSEQEFYAALQKHGRLYEAYGTATATGQGFMAAAMRLAEHEADMLKAYAAAQARIAELEAQLSAIPVLVEWLLENESGYLVWRDTNSRRQFMQRLREEMDVANAVPGEEG